jgi:hypothetical protein
LRLIGILLIVAGLFYAIARPWFNSNFTGEEFAQTVFFDKAKSNDRNRGWQISKVFLEEENNPARIRIKVLRIPGRVNDNKNMKLLVRVAPIGRDGATQTPILNQPVTINLVNETSNSQPATEPKRIFASTEEFEITRTGQFQIGAFPISPDNVTIGQPELKIDGNITRIEAVVMGGVEKVSSSGPMLGVALVILGIVLLSIFKRLKSRPRGNNLPHRNRPAKEIPRTDAQPEKASKNAPPVSRKSKPVPKPQTNVGKTIKWGRDAGKDG